MFNPEPKLATVWVYIRNEKNVSKTLMGLVETINKLGRRSAIVNEVPESSYDLPAVEYLGHVRYGESAERLLASIAAHDEMKMSH